MLKNLKLSYSRKETNQCQNSGHVEMKQFLYAPECHIWVFCSRLTDCFRRHNLLWPGLCVPLDWALIDSICMFSVFGWDVMTSWAGTGRVTLTVATRVHTHSMLLSCSFSFKSNICILYSKAMNTSYDVQVMNLWWLGYYHIGAT